MKEKRIEEAEEQARPEPSVRELREAFSRSDEAYELVSAEDIRLRAMLRVQQ